MNAELIFEKLHLIRKLKFRISNSLAVIFFHSTLSYFWVIHNLYVHIFRKFKNDFVSQSFDTKQIFNKKIIL